MRRAQLTERGIDGMLKKYKFLILITILILAGCKSTNFSDSRPLGKKLKKEIKVLKSLHDKIVYVELDDSQYLKGGTQLYYLKYIDPAEDKPHLILKTEKEIATSYLSNREKMVIRSAVSSDTKTGNIYFADINGSHLKKVVRGNGFSIFPDKERFAFSSDLSEGQQTFFIYSANLRGKQIERLTFRPRGITRKVGPKYMYVGDSSPVVSLDEKFVFFTSNWHRQAEGNDIFRINANGSNRKQLTNGENADLDYSSLVISHDGKKIAVLEKDKKNKSSIVIVNTKGDILKKYPLAVDSPNDYPAFAWSPDDNYVVIQEIYTLSILNLKSGKLNTILSLSKDSNQVLQSVNWLE